MPSINKQSASISKYTFPSFRFKELRFRCDSKCFRSRNQSMSDGSMLHKPHEALNFPEVEFGEPKIIESLELTPEECTVFDEKHLLSREPWSIMRALLSRGEGEVNHRNPGLTQNRPNLQSSIICSTIEKIWRTLKTLLEYWMDNLGKKMSFSIGVWFVIASRGWFTFSLCIIY